MQRFYESKEIADAYIKYRPTYPNQLVEQVMQYRSRDKTGNKTYDLLIDVGCGSGQACTLFQPYFKHIVAIDISKEQIKQAINGNKHENISYQVGSAEKIPADDNSVDMVIAGIAAHWFNLHQFFKEVKRVLKPQGCLAIFGYVVHSFQPLFCENERLARQSAKLFYDTLKKGFPENDKKAKRSLLEACARCQDIYKAIPFHTKKRVDDLFLTVEVSLSDCKGRVRSTDCYERYMKKKLKELKKITSDITQEDVENVDLSLEFVQKLKSLWNLEGIANNDEKVIKVTLNNYVLLTRPSR